MRLEELMNSTYVVNGRSFNLVDLGWSYGTNTRRKAAGVCKLRLKRIEVSTFFEVSDDTILHEIAHAIDYEIRGKTDHSKAWKSVAVQVGARPSRFVSRDESPDPTSYKYTGTCPKCKRQTGYSRKLKRARSCGPCGNGTYDPSLKIEITKNY